MKYYKLWMHSSHKYPDISSCARAGCWLLLTQPRLRNVSALLKGTLTRDCHFGNVVRTCGDRTGLNLEYLENLSLYTNLKQPNSDNDDDRILEVLLS